MTKTIAKGYKDEVEFHADVPYQTRPKIYGILNGKDGVRYYIGKGKIYVADLFDKYFNCQVQFKIKGRYHKGELIGGGGIW